MKRTKKSRAGNGEKRQRCYGTARGEERRGETEKENIKGK